MKRKLRYKSDCFVCPVCLANYGRWFIDRSGNVCGDQSLGQKAPCSGKPVPLAEFQRYEWRTPYQNDDGTPIRRGEAA